VHVMFFAERVGLTPEQVGSLTHGSADDGCWSTRERLLIRAADAVHDHGDLDDRLWDLLAAELGDAEILDVLFLCGWYHAISWVVRAARVALEPGAPRFADVRRPSERDAEVHPGVGDLHPEAEVEVEGAGP